MQNQRVRETKNTTTTGQPEPVNAARPAFVPLHPILRLQRSVGNQAVQRLLRSRPVHAKFPIDRTGDVSEPEADRGGEEARSRVVLGHDRYEPNTRQRERPLAHGLTLAVRQVGLLQPRVVQRQGMGDLRLAEAISELIDKIRATAAYKALDAANVRLSEESSPRYRNVRERTNTISYLNSRCCSILR
jgi:hypothetical protein